MIQNWTVTWLIASTLVISALGIIVWKKKKRSYVCVGKVSRLFFYPVKSLKGIEVQKGTCSSLGFVVDGLLDRTFMIVDDKGRLVSQRTAPTLVLLTPSVNANVLSISSPSGDALDVEIKESITAGDKICHCMVHADSIDALDCGDKAAHFFQTYLSHPGVRLVQYFPSLIGRKYLANDPFKSKIRKKYQIGFQDFAAFHLVSQASIEDLNSNLEDDNVSVLNFRPNILVEGCNAFEEDSWEYVRFDGGAELSQLIPTTRCVMTTNNPSTGILTKKEPTITMRKYRIPKNPKMLKKTGSLPCMGVSFAVLKNGNISVGEEIYAHVGEMPEMVNKLC